MNDNHEPPKKDDSEGNLKEQLESYAGNAKEKLTPYAEKSKAYLDKGLAWLKEEDKAQGDTVALVKKPFYKKRWFILAIAVLLVAGIISAIVESVSSSDLGLTMPEFIHGVNRVFREAAPHTGDFINPNSARRVSGSDMYIIENAAMRIRAEINPQTNRISSMSATIWLSPAIAPMGAIVSAFTSLSGSDGIDRISRAVLDYMDGVTDSARVTIEGIEFVVSMDGNNSVFTVRLAN